MAEPSPDNVLFAARALVRAKCPVALTGAGISVPSGIPDFRSFGGLWSRYDPELVCSEWALRKNPRGVWQFLLETMEIFSQARPNEGHQALATLEGLDCLSAVVTQNIDGLHQAAGSRQVIEYHGNCRNFYCHSCGRPYPKDRVLETANQEIPICCQDCNGTIRPEAVFFGEGIPDRAMSSCAELTQQADVLIIAGTSGAVAPINMIPRQVYQNGGTLIECNLGTSAFEPFSSIRFAASAELVLPQIAAQVRRLKQGSDQV